MPADPEKPRTTTMAKFLFTLWEGGGETPPILSVVRAVAEAGHAVTVLADDVLGPDVEAAGAIWVPWETAPNKSSYSPDQDLARDWEAKTPLGAFQRFRDGIAFGPSARYARDTLAQIRRDRPDVVVNPTLMFGAQAAAEAAAVPQALLLTCSYVVPGTGAAPYGSGWAPPRNLLERVRLKAMDKLALRLWGSGGPPLNAARSELGLAPVAHPLDQLHAAERFLVLTSETFDFPVPRLPANVRYVGPRLDDPAWAGRWTPPPGDKPLVLVGMSSTYMEQRDVLRRTAAALGELPVRALVTLGPALEPDALGTVPDNVTVVAAAPHAEVLRHASAVVTHAGHGTIIKALAAGVPIVALPMGRDQPDNAARAVAAGAGVALKPAAKVAAIRAAVADVLGTPGYAEGARRVARAIAAESTTDRALAELEALAADVRVAALR
ncbi:MAG TPA: nucleotide disphospho-sugar-binding domain-containing protein [Baekduia sp.]|uniref:nucleotide disphospho-sugar-binding domain-containing protein n=1 Tax=Baekduia sp. TaxID=2600305 RepID=UPI002C1EA35C|nr:nucleotide disphospho-sugar-binding domain-containing protein [Baekduia sp.]HMJ34745.1 nucleotide disphospho-sugar-binding domain-containing protein [Baekduia sp.]